MKEKLNICENISSNKLFLGLSDEHIKNICNYLEKETFNKGEYIIREEDPQNKIYMLIRGSAQVEITGSKNEQIPIRILTEGDFFGELASFTKGAKRTASIVALSKVNLLSLSTQKFDELIHNYPDIMKNVLINTARQLLESNKQIMYRSKIEREIFEQRVRERTLKLQEKNNLLKEKNEQIHKELLLAQNIQRKFLPKDRVSFKGITVESYYLPCEELGGDICGVKQIDRKRILIYGGDVSGHGVSTSLITIYLKHLIENIATSEKEGKIEITEPGDVLTRLNKSFIEDLNEGDPSLYFTVFYAIYSREEKKLSYSSAGIHVPPILFREEKDDLLFKQSDFPIGHITDNRYKTYSKKIKSGDFILFVSDGVTEAWNGKEIFGIKRLIDTTKEIIKQEKTIDIKKLHKRVENFLNGEKPLDDMCYLTIHFE